MASEIKWIKITTDMFEDEKIDFISSLPDADAIIVIWIRLLALAGKCNAGGYVFLTEKIPYTDEMLAHKFKKPLSTVKMALETFRRLDMIELDGQVIYLPNWEKHQNIDGMEKIKEQNRLRKQKQRSKTKELPPPSQENKECHVTVTGQSQRNHALEVDKELDLLSTTTTTETVVDVYRKVFNLMNMNGLMTDYIQNLMNRGYTEVFIKEVMYEVGESSSKPSLNYFKTIAERWIGEGIYTRMEAKKRREADRPNLRLASNQDKPKSKAQLALEMEIARNKWIDEGNDPNEFVFNPTA